MDDTEQPVEEVLVLRVVSEAHRRRVRRAVVAGLVAVVASAGAAIGLTHRSGTQPMAHSAPPIGPIPAISAAGSADTSRGKSVRAAILEVARARYAPERHSGVDGRTHLEFGRLSVTGTRATLQVNFVCVPLCGHGEELTLVKRDSAWLVAGVRTTWVS